MSRTRLPTGVASRRDQRPSRLPREQDAASGGGEGPARAAARPFLAALTNRFLATVLVAAAATNSTSAQDEVTADQLLPMHRQAAAAYTVHVSPDSDRTLTFDPRPVLVWSNPRRARGQIGHVFLWMDGERPGAIGTILSHPTADFKQRRVYHEMHSLCETTIVPDREQRPLRWRPRGGIRWIELKDAPSPADNPARRNLQLRQIARGFEAHTVDREGQQWPLRMLPTPLFRFESSGKERTFGAIFTLLGDAGSDPELFLLVQSGKDAAGKRVWKFAPARMTDHESFLSYRSAPVWESVRTETDTHFESSDGTYQRFFDGTVDPPGPASPEE